MKKKLYLFFKRIFINELVEERQHILNPYFEKERQVQEEMKELKQFKRQYELLERIFWEFPSAKIVGIKEDKLGNQYFIVDVMDTIYLYSWNCIRCKPRLYYEIHQNKDGQNIMEIVDVQMETINKGQGTIAMEALLKIAKEQKVSKILGEMALCDDDHADRREHFYKKFGFTISDRRATLMLA